MLPAITVGAAYDRRTTDCNETTRSPNDIGKPRVDGAETCLGPVVSIAAAHDRASFSDRDEELAVRRNALQALPVVPPGEEKPPPPRTNRHTTPASSGGGSARCPSAGAHGVSSKRIPTPIPCRRCACVMGHQGSRWFQSAPTVCVSEYADSCRSSIGSILCFKAQGWLTRTNL